MLWGEPLSETAKFMDQVRREAMVAGKTPPGFSLSTRPILAETDDKAWDRARDILRRVQARRGGVPPPKPENLGSQRLLAAAKTSAVHDT
jgi:alkanesulfonate monooxygenase